MFPYCCSARPIRDNASSPFLPRRRSLHVSRTAILGHLHREMQSAIAFVACGVEFPYFLHKFFAARQVQRLLFFVDAGFEGGQQHVDFLDVGLRANGMQVNGYFFVIARGREQLIVKKCIFARGRWIFLCVFLTSPVGEKIFR